jgi:hypothetical protein
MRCRRFEQEITVLKKAGIVVASATAGLLAVSPLAFADGLVNIDDNAVQIPVQACNNNVINNIGLGILGRGSAKGGNNKGKCKQDTSARSGSRHHHHHDHD